MGLILLILMIGVPIAEIAVFIEAGEIIGFWSTIGVIILTAIIGTFFLRYQGLGVLTRVFQSLQNNELPVKDMFDGLCLLFAGVLLLTPGFITDTVGFSLLIPPFRQALAELIIQHLNNSGRFHAFSPNSDRTQPPGSSAGPIIDGDYDEIDTQNDRLPPGKS